MLKSSCEHFFHGRIIIRSLYGLDLELTVIVSLRTSVFIDHHRTYRLKTADIGNIKCLDSSHMLETQPFSDLVHGADGAKLLALDLLFILIQYQLCIFRCQFHQSVFLALLRHHELHALSASLGQPFLNQFHLTEFLLYPNLARDKRSSCVKLLYKASDDLLLIFCRRHRNMKMFSADDLAVTHKKHLHHRIFLIPGHGDDVSIFHGLAGDLLFFRDLLYTLDQFTVFDGSLEFHLLGCFHHFLFQHGKDRLVISV